MENVAVTTLEINGTEKVATTMKELKQQIVDYRNELVALGQIENKNEQQMEEQTRVIEKLKKATKLLSDVTNAHKNTEGQLNKAIDKNTASYNELQAELTRLKKAYKDMSAMERDSEFGKETLKTISDLDVKLKDLDAGMGQYQRNVGNYGQTFEESMAKARQSSGYLSQGISTLNGALALAGSENEGLQKALTATTLALQLVQNEGVGKLIVKLKEMISAKVSARAAAKAQAAETKALSGAMKAEAAATTAATTATNLFKKALIATGIGVIIVAIGTLISRWDDLTAALGIGSGAHKKAIEQMKKDMESLADEYEVTIGRMKAMGASQGEVYHAEMEQLENLYNLQVDITNSVIRANASMWKSFWNEDEIDEALDAAEEAKRGVKEKYNEAYNYLLGFLRDSEAAIKASERNPVEQMNVEVNAKIREMQNLLFTLNSKGIITDDEYWKLFEQIVAYGEFKVKEIEALGEQIIDEYNAAKKAIYDAREKEFNEQDERALAEEEAYWKEQSEAHVDAILAPIEAQKAADAEAQRLREEREAAMMEEVRLMNEAAMEEKARLDELAEKEEEWTKAKKEGALASADATASMLAAISDAIESFDAENEKSQKAAKGIKIAATTIETISGATSAYMAAQTLPPPYGQIVGATNAAAVLATGMANIAKMKATSIASSSVPSFSSPSASVSAPNVPTQLDAVRNLTSASEEERLNRMAQSQKVYILQSDIEAAGAASKVQVTESTF